jgi:hypothetical protein
LQLFGRGERLVASDRSGYLAEMTANSILRRRRMYERPMLERYGTFREITLEFDIPDCIPELTPGCNEYPTPPGQEDRS